MHFTHLLVSVLVLFNFYDIGWSSQFMDDGISLSNGKLTDSLANPADDNDMEGDDFMVSNNQLQRLLKVFF